MVASSSSQQQVIINMDHSGFNPGPPPTTYVQGAVSEFINEAESESIQLTPFNASLQVAAIVWTVFNIVLALITATKIIYPLIRCQRKSRCGIDDSNQNRNFLSKFFRNSAKTVTWRIKLYIPTEDTFPLILLIAIAVQGTIFLYAQTKNIDGKNGMDYECKKASEIIWAGTLYQSVSARLKVTNSPASFLAIWVIPALALVFSLECLARCFARRGFPARKSFTTVICILITVVLTTTTCIPLRLSEISQGDLCNGQLLRFINQYSLGGLGLAGVLIPFLVFILIGIWSNLEGSTDVPIEERISAIKTCGYTALVALQMVYDPQSSNSAGQGTNVGRPLLYHILQLLRPLMSTSLC